VGAPEINAFAAPEGQEVNLRGLLEKTASPEQLAGVLAHELNISINAIRRSDP
jgi:predicted Zn-dependent protease